jgi:ribonuclease HI
VRQIEGRYRVKHPDMLPLYREALSLLRRFEEASVVHVHREQNREADRLANRALDERSSKLT